MKQTKSKCPENQNQLNESYQENNAFFFNGPNQIQMRQNLCEVKNYQEIKNENDQNHINSAPSTCIQNQVHRRIPVFVEVNNDEKNEFIDKMKNKNTLWKTESTEKYLSQWLKSQPRYEIVFVSREIIMV